MRATISLKPLSISAPSQPPAAFLRAPQIRGWQEDISGHLYQLAGFRYNPRSRGVNEGIVHINVYTTDKSVTYQLHEGIFKTRKCSDLYPRPLEKLCSDLHKVADSFAVCSGSEGQIQDGTARFELRVQMSKIHETLLTFPDNLIHDSVISIPSDIWW